MRILLMVQRLWQGGGTETHVLTLADKLRRRGHVVVIYTSGGEWVGYGRGRGLHVQVEPHLLQGGPSAVSRFTSYLQSHQFDVVHAHDGPSFLTAVNSRQRLLAKPRLVLTVHGTYIGTDVMKRARYGADRVIAVSPAIRNVIINRTAAPPHKVHTISNGISTDTFRPKSGASFRNRCQIPTGAFVIGYCARFTLGKVNLGRRIGRVLRQFSRNHNGVHILIAGRNSRAVLISSSKFHVLGHVGPIEDLYNACDVVIGAARVAAESLACGTPTIVLGASGYHGMASIRKLKQLAGTNFGDHGTVTSWSDSLLIQDLRFIRQHPHIARRETNRVRQRIIRTRTADSMADRMESVYKGVLQTRV